MSGNVLMLAIPHFAALLALAAGLGLLGFIEPCTVGAHLVFLSYLRGKARREQVAQTATFAITRALFMGLVGAVITLLGRLFFDVQRGFWLALGVGYVVLGLVYLAGKQGSLSRELGPRFGTPRGRSGAVAAGLLFGLNIPACAAPLIGALLAASVGSATVSGGFLVMLLFGIALALPLVVAVFWEPARGMLDRLATGFHNVPRWTGVLFVLLGVWSIAAGLRT
ncbi:MAG: hypothetical protein NVS2B7_38520 [Herpetosiphon sp.]